MNITSAQYMNATNLADGTTYLDNIKATVDGEEVFVPITVGNRHYDEIMRQVAAGTLTIADAD